VEPPAGPPARKALAGSFARGVNLPWLNYGTDFGSNAWGRSGVSEPGSRARLRDQLARVADGGSSVVRWFLLCDGRAGLRVDGGGALAGLDDRVLADLDAAIDEVSRARLRVIFVLLDFLWFAPARLVDGVTLGGRRATVLSEDGRARLLDHVLVPIVARAAGSDAVAAWDLLNEPEWVTSGFGGAARHGAIGRRRMRRFLEDAVPRLRSVSPHAVTVGLASACGLDLVRNLGLDFYQVHWYDTVESRAPLSTPVTELRLDGPLLLGEFPARDSAYAPERIEAIARHAGYAGALVWADGTGVRS
jgi:hypothetical protein